MSRAPPIGSRISLITRSRVRYTGILVATDHQENTFALSSVLYMGTEGRQTPTPTPPRSDIYELVVFRASDVLEMNVVSHFTPPVELSIDRDPAIVSHSEPQTYMRYLQRVAGGSGGGHPYGAVGGPVGSGTRHRAGSSGAIGSLLGDSATEESSSRNSSGQGLLSAAIAEESRSQSQRSSRRKTADDEARAALEACLNLPAQAPQVAMYARDLEDTQQRAHTLLQHLQVDLPQTSTASTSTQSGSGRPRRRHSSGGGKPKAAAEETAASAEPLTQRPKQQQRSGRRSEEPHAPPAQQQQQAAAPQPQGEYQQRGGRRGGRGGYQRGGFVQRGNRYGWARGGYRRPQGQGHFVDHRQEGQHHQQHQHQQQGHGGPRRGGGWNRGRYNWHRNEREVDTGSATPGTETANPTHLPYNTPYDFDAAQAEFKKTLEEEAKKTTETQGSPASGSEGETDGAAAGPSTSTCASAAAATAAAPEQKSYYVKAKFFDNISCETKDDSRKHEKKDWRDERKFNAETFGLVANKTGPGRAYFSGRYQGFRRGTGRRGGNVPGMPNGPSSAPAVKKNPKPPKAADKVTKTVKSMPAIAEENDGAEAAHGPSA